MKSKNKSKQTEFEVQKKHLKQTEDLDIFLLYLLSEESGGLVII